ncbi:MAG: hypothetical protein RL199_39 [Pseudomonadota bacterium]
MILQLNPVLEVDTPKGRGHAEFLIDYGPEADLLWVVVMRDTGEIWTLRNADIRATANVSIGRKLAARIDR